MATFRIGTSGYQYKHWRGRFYPEELPQKKWFEYYAEHFDTVEINNTFYNLPQASTFQQWHDRAPAGFRYALKFSRFGTHLKKLKNPQQSIDMFMERAVCLKSFLGPILVQLPPHWGADAARLDAFLDAAPSEQRWAVEFRDPSWLCDAVYDALRKHNAALCIHDLLPNHPHVFTADWTYLRFHGNDYSHCYSRQALTAAAQRIKKYLEDGRDVYAYFNNDANAHAIANAADLRRYVANG